MYYIYIFFYTNIIYLQSSYNYSDHSLEVGREVLIRAC